MAKTCQDVKMVFASVDHSLSFFSSCEPVSSHDNPYRRFLAMFVHNVGFRSSFCSSGI